jgi:hypothetical protein
MKEFTLPTIYKQCVYPPLHTSRTLISVCYEKKYDTIVKGFKTLEANYEESKKKLAISEETAHVARAAYIELVSEAEASQTVIRDREQVRHDSGGESLPSIFDRKLGPENRYEIPLERRIFVEFSQEITVLREELEASRKTVLDREEVRHYFCGDHLRR